MRAILLVLLILSGAFLAGPVSAQEDDTPAPTEALEATPPEPPAAEAAPTPSDPAPAAETPSTAAAPVPKPPEPDGNDFRIGFWEIDFLALDHEPRGTTFRFLDFKIFRFLEVGQGPDYQAFSLFEMPQLLNLFTTRREGDTRELRVLDVQAISLAMARQTQESQNASSSELLKLPVLGSVFAVETAEEQPTIERQTYLFLLRRDVPR